MSSTDFLVKELKVSGSFKNWADPSKSSDGRSGGSEFEMTVIPHYPQEYWTPQEAQVVAFDVRMQIHVVLMADAQKRGVKIPAEAHSALIQYRQEVDRLKNSLGETVGWRDADEPPPSSPELITSENLVGENSNEPPANVS